MSPHLCTGKPQKEIYPVAVRSTQLFHHAFFIPSKRLLSPVLDGAKLGHVRSLCERASPSLPLPHGQKDAGRGPHSK